MFTIFGAPIILQSDNGREFVAKIIEELSNTWKELKTVHEKPRRPQSQGSVERSNRDTKQLMGMSSSNKLSLCITFFASRIVGKRKQLYKMASRFTICAVLKILLLS